MCENNNIATINNDLIWKKNINNYYNLHILYVIYLEITSFLI